jgi:hypothetical protein
VDEVHAARLRKDRRYLADIADVDRARGDGLEERWARLELDPLGPCSQRREARVERLTPRLEEERRTNLLVTEMEDGAGRGLRRVRCGVAAIAVAGGEADANEEKDRRSVYAQQTLAARIDGRGHGHPLLLWQANQSPPGALIGGRGGSRIRRRRSAAPGPRGGDDKGDEADHPFSRRII